MSLRILLMRFGIAAAGGALVAFAATTPAIGVDREDPGKKYIVNGEVTARAGLVLRSAPTRGGAAVRVAKYGEIVQIYCRTLSQNIDGNRQWYLLTDGTWAWGSARYIAAWKTPRWC
ncbi:SH3 domain-containing protein [Streptomyces sp. CA-210063]|uniref:SH3 domain-containing protein n=1 Tax=Streptomyces sp. CA-210063 TaxID=2801029 RepID=UPI00214B09A0|nr:SH3 domain-containing protein [Streptomyces sp. CA-210063]UUU30924.1 SH3 domain-containing protein [Streptomyces sp. CA-210063]